MTRLRARSALSSVCWMSKSLEVERARDVDVALQQRALEVAAEQQVEVAFDGHAFVVADARRRCPAA